MTLAKLSRSMYPSFPSLFDRFFDGELMDWNRSNYSSTNSTLPAVNVKEDDNKFLIEVAAPGMTKKDFKVNFDNGKVKKSYQIMPSVNISYSDNIIKLSAKEGFEKASVDVGMDRSNIKNIVLGLQIPFKIVLEINGVGYKASVEKTGIICNS